MFEFIKNIGIITLLSTLFFINIDAINPSPKISRLEVSPNGKYLAASYSAKVAVDENNSPCNVFSVVDPGNIRKIFSLYTECYILSEVVFSPNGKLLAIATIDRLDNCSILIFDTNNFILRNNIIIENFFSLCFLNDNTIVYGSVEGNIYVYDVISGLQLKNLSFSDGVDDAVDNISFSTNKKYIVASTLYDPYGDRKSHVRIFNFSTDICIKELAFRENVINVLFSPDDKHLAVITENKVYLYSIKQNNTLEFYRRIIIPRGDYVTASAFSSINSDSRYFLTIGCKNTIRNFVFLNGDLISLNKHDICSLGQSKISADGKIFDGYFN